ncbi:MAG: ligase-associated DNA damage response endonuclease PdeM [Sphingobium sp.]
MVPFLFHDAALHLLGCGAAWWPEQETLLVADLHLEKARFFAGTGQFLPPHDSYETALRLAERVKQTGARRIICLGDSFHDGEGASHLEARAGDVLRSLATRAEWIWVTGNHDVSAVFPFGRAVAEVRLGGIDLRHEVDPAATGPEISGHFHPKLRLQHRGRNLVRRCFLTDGTRLIIPAFGALTGGLDARHPAIHAVLGGPVTALVPGEGRLMRFPVEPALERCAS